MSKQSAYPNFYFATVQSTASDRNTVTGMGALSGVVTFSCGVPKPLSTDKADPRVAAAWSPKCVEITIQKVGHSLSDDEWRRGKKKEWKL